MHPVQSFPAFARANARWLGGGLVLTFFSCLGQTFLIAQFSAQIRAEHALSHGDFGALYMIATLASATTLALIGRVVDEHRIASVATATILALAAACLLMATARTALTLCLALFLLRLFGQGMMTHTAMTAMGRWFDVERGRAVSLCALGLPIGEALLPIALVALLGVIDWRALWVGGAALLVLLALPLARVLLGTPRVPIAGESGALASSARQWTRAEVLRDLPFWVVCTGALAPAFIGTSVFFHQGHLGEIKGWPPTLIAASFPAMSLATVIVALATGQLVDRVGARRLLPYFLVPLALACAVLALGTHPLAMPAFMLLLGTSMGISNTLLGAFWPEIYGTRHLGAVRSLVFAAMVLSSALGPGLTGYLIDHGVPFETQLLVMALYCVAAIASIVPVSRLLERRVALEAASFGA